MSTLKPWLDRVASISGRVTIVGTCKNAGKTTALNFLLRQLSLPDTSITSIGRDGELIDIVGRHPKPPVQVGPEVLFATAEQSLGRCDGPWESLRPTGLMTPLGEVVIARSQGLCRLELAGPGTVDGLLRLAGQLERLGAQRLWIDGALDRTAAATPRLSDAAIVCAGSSDRHSETEVAADLKSFLNRFNIPTIAPEHTGEVLSVLSLTSADLDALRGRTILLPGPSSCFLQGSDWERLDSLGIRLFVSRTVPVLAVFVSSFRPHLRPLSPKTLLELCRLVSSGSPVFDLAQEGFLEG